MGLPRVIRTLRFSRASDACWVGLLVIARLVPSICVRRMSVVFNGVRFKQLGGSSHLFAAVGSDGSSLNFHLFVFLVRYNTVSRTNVLLQHYLP